MEKKVLILSDQVCFGSVALHTARSILTRRNRLVYALPTALLSNTWNYGAVAHLDTTDFLKNSLAVWEDLGMTFDAVLIGYVADEDQARWLAERCRGWRAAGIPIFLDPLFADLGKRYHGISETQVQLLRQLMAEADYILPNLTESCFLADLPYPSKPGDLMEALGKRTDAHVIITGVNDSVVFGRGGQWDFISYTALPGSFSGAGDCFAAIFLDKILRGASLKDSVLEAIVWTQQLLAQNCMDDFGGTGIPVERYY